VIKTTIDFPHLPDSGLLQFSSLTEFVGWLDTQPQGHENQASRRATVREVIANGWPEVLDALATAEEETRAAFAPVRTNPWGYQGGRVSLDRMLMGKPCIARPRKVSRNDIKFVRIVFCGEAMACAGSEQFIHKCAELLAYIRRAEGRGQRIELWGAWGGYFGYGGVHAGKSSMTFCKVKAFGDPINLPLLSAVGHIVMLRTLQFASEEVGIGGVGNCAHTDKANYTKALTKLTDAKSAESAHICLNIHDIDPLNWLGEQ